MTRAQRINSTTRRKARSRMMRQQRAELEAQQRVDARKTASASVRVSDAAALQGLKNASPAARRFVLGMILHVFGVGGTDACVFDDACKAVGDRRVNWQVIDELHSLGILRWDGGSHILHRLFSSTGQQWAQIASQNGRAVVVDGTDVRTEGVALSNLIEFGRCNVVG